MRKNIKNIGFSLIIIILLISAFYNGIGITKYEIKSEKFSKDKNIRIVLISDLHNHIYGDSNKKLIEKIKKEHPDIIALAGDIGDDVTPIEGTKLLLDGLKGVAPMYYVAGNHEYWSNDIKNIKSVFKYYGVEILENQSMELNIKDINISISGVEDPFSLVYDEKYLNSKKYRYKDLMEKVKDIDENRYNILLAHRPEEIDLYREYNFDMVLSGHAHGGQVRIPFLLKGLYAPDQGFFPKYAGGIYKYNDLYHIVSRGLSFNVKLPRIYNPPEIVVIDIKGSN